MPDVRTAWAPTSWPWGGDWLAAPPGLAADHDLETAVLLSLLTDASAHPDDELPDRSTDRRGWWANLNRPEGYALGSRLWLLTRTVSTDETRQLAEAYTEEALAWLLDADVASRVVVSAAYLDTPPSMLGIAIEITRGTSQRYAWVWDQLAQDGVAPTTVVVTIEVSAMGIRPVVGRLAHAV